jgi:hypothetical protein
MGIEYSTNNYAIIENVIDKQPVLLCSIDINDYINLEEVNRYLIYKHNSDNEYLFYYGKIPPISDFTRINEELLVKKSKKYNNFLELDTYIKNNIKDPHLINSLNNYRKINISPDMNYLNSLM